MKKINNSKNILKEYFGYETFRKGQEDIISHILDGKDVLGIMPTGAGKSICFQIPALIFKGITIVISPLISLMKDQVDGLNEMGIKATYINSSLGMEEIRERIINVKNGEYKIVYIAPERLDSDFFHDFIKCINISLFVIDEAHCISEWGHDFRPSYKKIRSAIDKIKVRPIIAAFTATATSKVKDDIVKILDLNDPFTLVTGFDRENLYFNVLKPEDRFKTLIETLDNYKNFSGIIYCLTRKTVENLCEKLNSRGISAAKYHAGLSDVERTRNQEKFLSDDISIIVATNAFGMGIDKSNVRFVIHYNMPKTVENYYQEAGRAGRDGERADCILFFSSSDIITNKFLIESKNEENTKTDDYKKLNDMVNYVNTEDCLRNYILKYFGENNLSENCSNCGNCNNEIEKRDITIESQKILSCIKRMGERFGSGLISDVLRGSRKSKVMELGFNNLSTYGIMKDMSDGTIKEIISYLVADSYIAVSGDKYPVLALNNRSIGVLKGETKIYTRKIVANDDKNEVKNILVNEELFYTLRNLRKSIAESENVPPFVIFSDATLNDMCKKLPIDENHMLKVSGVGKYKLESYGREFITEIKKYVEENNIDISSLRGVSEESVISLNDDKQKTHIVTYDLFKTGKSIEEISKLRNFTQNTIENHLLKCIEEGIDINYDFGLNEENEKLILNVINEVGVEKLKPIKEKLSDDISYGQIKYVFSKYNLKIQG